MANFSEVLTHLKNGFSAKRQIVKNHTVIQIYKKRLFHNVFGVRASYIPTNKDLMADDWVLITKTK